LSGSFFCFPLLETIFKQGYNTKGAGCEKSLAAYR
jgi:hypothetical protein